ncbi:MAG: hypothetical protein ACFFCW_25260 [Candidatus Hodarchaeota archaeon]
MQGGAAAIQGDIAIFEDITAAVEVGASRQCAGLIDLDHAVRVRRRAYRQRWTAGVEIVGEVWQWQQGA